MKDILRDVMKDICSTIFMKPSGLSFEEPPVKLNKYFGMQRRDNVSLLGRRRTLGLKRFKSIGKKKKKSLLGTHGDLRHNSRGRFSVEVKKKIRRSARPKCISQACDGSTKSPGLYDIAPSPLLSFSHHPEMRLAGRKMYPILICFFLAC